MNYNSNLCLARLKSNNNKQCSRKSKKGCIYCGIHLKVINSGKIVKRIDINYNLINFYKPFLNEIILIQKIIRAFIIRNINYMKGPGLFKRYLSNNKTDFLTFEKIIVIPYSNYFSFRDSDGFIYSFNILTLVLIFELFESILALAI